MPSVLDVFIVVVAWLIRKTRGSRQGSGCHRSGLHVRRHRRPTPSTTPVGVDERDRELWDHNCDSPVRGVPPTSSSWRDRDDVSDYVWCLEEEVNASEHEANFPDVPTPTDARDNAGRPSGWNANDIRRTWEMNVGT